MKHEHKKPEPEHELAQENNQAAFVQKYYHVSYDDVFEYVAVVVRARRHFHCLRPTLHRKCFVNLLSFFLKLFNEEQVMIIIKLWNYLKFHLFFFVNMPSFFPLSHNSLPNSHLWKTFNFLLE